MLVDPYTQLANVFFALRLQAGHPRLEQTNKRELAVRAVFP
jgi:hypothetical protein